MTLRARFLLVACGVIIFFVAAPAAIFFARGYYFDFVKKQIVKTSTLVTKTDPRGARVRLNGRELRKDTSLVQRFIIPGEYNVEIRKPGYRSWKKRMVFHPEMVTYLPLERPEKIPLFFEQPVKTIISTTTADILIGSTQNDTYYLSSPPQARLLRRLGNGEAHAVSDVLPPFTKSEIIVSPGKQIFLRLDSELYEVKEDLEKLNSGVSYAYWTDELPGLVYGSNHEVWLREPNSRSPSGNLVTRSSRNLGRARYNKKTSYVFVTEDNQIKAYEYDFYGQPNIYFLAETQNPETDIFVDDHGENLIYRDVEQFINLKIR